MSVARSTHPGVRTALRLDRAAQIIEKKLESEPLILELLVGSAVKGQAQRQMWDALHVAAVRDGRVAELGAAYDQLLQSTKMKLILAPIVAEVLTRAAAFFEEMAADADKAATLLQRALAAAPVSAEAFSRLEGLLTARQDTRALIDFYAGAAGHRPTVEEQLALLRRAAELAEFVPDKPEQAIQLYQQIVRLDPSDRVGTEALETHYLRSGRVKDAAKWLEQVLASRPNKRDADELALRERLMRLYCEQLDERDRALPHAEVLLAKDAMHNDALEAARSLLTHRALGPRAAAAVASALDRSGDFAGAASVLELQLSGVRGTKRLELVRRLAALKQDQLADPEGAWPLLEEAIGSDISDEDARRRYREVSATLGRGTEAVKLLASAAANVKDPATRLAIEAELGQFALERGDLAGARAAFEKVLAAAAGESSMLLAARGLAAVYDEREAAKLAGALAIAARLEKDDTLRWAATERLALLYQNDLHDPPKAVEAWKELIGSPLSGRALDALEMLYHSTGDDEQLAAILELRSVGSGDEKEARLLATRAAHLRAGRAADGRAALAIWRELVQTYGASREVHAHLFPLLEKEGAFAELADGLRQEIALAPREEHADLLTRLGLVCLRHLKDSAAALEAFRAVLALDPHAAAARKAVEGLLKSPDAALRAAELLEPIYRQDQQWAGLLTVLEARVKATTALESRLAILEEMTVILEQHQGDLTRALKVAGEGLRIAVGNKSGKVGGWVTRVEQLSEKAAQPALLAAVLSRALGDHGVDSEAFFLLATRAADALLASGEAPKALVLYRAAADYKPTDLALKERIEGLVIEQGSVEDRIAVYRAGLDRSSDAKARRQNLQAIARIQSQEAGDDAAAIATLRVLLTETPHDVAAEDALFDALGRLGDKSGLYQELEGRAARVQGERRTALLVRMADVAFQSGQLECALGHYRELLAGARLGDDVLDAIERTAQAAGSAETLRDLLERRILGATDARQEVAWLEQLGDLHAGKLGNVEGAMTAFKRGADLATTAKLGGDTLRRLYERMFALFPGDRQAAERLVEMYREAGEWHRIPAIYDALLAHIVDERDAVRVVLDMEPSALQAGASRQFASAVDSALRRYVTAFSAHAQNLLAAKARVLSIDAASAAEAGTIFRSLVASADDGATLAEAFEAFLAKAPEGESRRAGAQWLAAWRANDLRGLDRTGSLLAAAKALESARNLSAAAEGYRRVLEYDSECITARFALIRLLLEVGNTEGALAALSDLRERTQGAVRAGIELRMGYLLSEKLDRTDEALAVILPVLEASPSDPTALPILQRALGRASSRPRAAAMLERASEAAPTKDRAASILRMLLGAPADTPELTEGRRGWYKRLLDLLAERPDEALITALQAAADFADAPIFWDAAEQLARSLRRPQPVMDAYRAMLEGHLSPEVAESVARRAVDFYEEWFEDPEGAITLLQRVQAQPGGGWAFERLKLAFISGERYAELLSLYDQAIDKAPGAGQAELLEEAAEAARNFARDADRAISYLERLAAIRSGDTSTLAALERLYERRGHHQRLVGLLETRLDATREVEAAQAIRARMAGLLLGMGNQVKALGLVEQMLAADSSSQDAYELLRRVLLPGEAPPAPLLSMAPSGISRSIAPKLDAVQPQPLTQQLVERAASLLKPRYLMQEKIEDVVRIIEVELAAADSDAERTVLYQQRARLHLEELGEIGLAFDSYVILVGLEPEVEEHRRTLAELATRLDRHARLADALVDAAQRSNDPVLQARLRVEAGRVYRDQIGDAPKAITLFSSVVDSCELGADIVLPAARELEPLLASQHVAADRCAVLDKIAALEKSKPARRVALGEVARISSAVLADPDRAARAWKARLDDDATDREALDGLVAVFESARRWGDLIEALDKRAIIAEPAVARADRARIAEVFAGELDAVGQAIATWVDIRRTFGPDEESFTRLSSLLDGTGRYEDLAKLLQEEIEASGDAARRVKLWGSLGDLCRDRLHDVERSARAYAESLRLDPVDPKSRQGLTEAQERSEVRSLAQQALARAYVAGEEWQNAAELAAKLPQGDDVPGDVARAFWWGVAGFQRDIRRDLATAEPALVHALVYDPSSIEILEALAAVQGRTPGRAYVLTTVRLSEVKGGDLRLLKEAADVAVRSPDEPTLAPMVCTKLFDLALARWSDDKAGSSAAKTTEGLASWALEQLILLADESGDVARAIELLRRGASLPFDRGAKRRMKQKAAQRTAEKLGDAEAALIIYRDLFKEDATDGVAGGSVKAFAELLERRGLHDELAALWEQQAAGLVNTDPTAAAELWDRSAMLAEEHLSDQARAIANHKRGAELGGLRSLEALARLYEQRGEPKEAAAVLERICELCPAETVVANTLRLADAYVADHDKGLARSRLEQAVERFRDADPLSQRLQQLYLEEEAWEVLADFLSTQADHAKEPAKRLFYLTQAVDVHANKLRSAEGVIPLLRQVIELEAENAAPRLQLANALIETHRAAEAVTILDAQLAHYGTRKPKDRALVHHALARALAASDKKRALKELEQAARIDPAHAEILHMLAQLALAEGKLDLANHTYQALLSLRRSSREDVDRLISRADLFKALADIAERKDDPDRAAELRASAAEEREGS
ncbi:MAG TPA: tetratricopeptide repeat protein [Polyangiaceae bacterium]|nr:tetratricopeptide repeat protein [Polyangiaceae bacterium]